ncbi:MAG TPA: minor capsid protein, partial [Desulfosporosinus sp.]|nr:minor capsid protein [Desulfosporosinus sp.]
AEMNRRFAMLAKVIREALIKLDVLAIQNLQVREFQFKTDTGKVEAFRDWLQQQIDANILTVEGTGKPWTYTYIDSAYKKGLERAYFETKKFTEQDDVFLRTSFFAPEMTSKLELVSLRAFEELKGISAHVSQMLNRILAQGLADGSHPREIAKDMTDQISSITKQRARVLARTEIIRAHAEGQLDGYENLGIKEVTGAVEWATAGDDRVCVSCESMEGELFSIKEARGLIPLHPNCRCAWLPAASEKLKAA